MNPCRAEYTNGINPLKGKKGGYREPKGKTSRKHGS